MSGQFGPVTADPVGLGRRIAGRVINAAIGVAIYAIMFLPLGETAATGYIRQPAWAAVLIAVVVAKLFFVELGNRGGLERIISFIGVGVLLLVVGYFAPLPPRKAEPEQVNA